MYSGGSKNSAAWRVTCGQLLSVIPFITLYVVNLNERLLLDLVDIGELMFGFCIVSYYVPLAVSTLDLRVICCVLECGHQVSVYIFVANVAILATIGALGTHFKNLIISFVPRIASFAFCLFCFISCILFLTSFRLSWCHICIRTTFKTG